MRPRLLLGFLSSLAIVACGARSEHAAATNAAEESDLAAARASCRFKRGDRPSSTIGASVPAGTVDNVVVLMLSRTDRSITTSGD